MKASGGYERFERWRCFRPEVPEPPRLEDIQDVLQAASDAVLAFDLRLSALQRPGAAGRLFARLDAVHSSGAEGSTTTFTDLMEYQSSLRSAPDVADAESVSACADALDAVLESGSVEPIAAAQKLHHRLFAGSLDRIAAGSAGQLKTRANRTADEDEATGFFTYTAPPSLPAVLDAWQAFTLADDPAMPELVRQGLSHWMFEHIHPFADGNGRVGRLLVPLMMTRKGRTRTACAYFAEAVHEDKQTYLDALKATRRSGSAVPWIRVFLGLVERTATANLSRLESLTAIEARWRRETAFLRSDSLVHRSCLGCSPSRPSPCATSSMRSEAPSRAPTARRPGWSISH